MLAFSVIVPFMTIAIRCGCRRDVVAVAKLFQQAMELEVGWWKRFVQLIENFLIPLHRLVNNFSFDIIHEFFKLLEHFRPVVPRFFIELLGFFEVRIAECVVRVKNFPACVDGNFELLGFASFLPVHEIHNFTIAIDNSNLVFSFDGLTRQCFGFLTDVVRGGFRDVCLVHF